MVKWGVFVNPPMETIPLIQALVGYSQVDLWIENQFALQSAFPTSQGYRENMSVKIFINMGWKRMCSVGQLSVLWLERYFKTLMTSCMFYSGSASCDLKKHHALCAQKHCVYWWVLLGIDGVGYQGGNISLGDWNWPQQKHWLPWWILVNEFILTNRSLILMCGGPTRMGRSDG